MDEDRLPDQNDVRSSESPNQSQPDAERRSSTDGDTISLSRRRLVQTGGVVAVTAGVAGVVANRVWGGNGGGNLGEVVNTTTANVAPVTFDQASGVENTPTQIPDPSQLKVLSQHEAATVDALTARILPGSADDPGAHEAGVVTYIDNFLAYNQGYAEWTFLQGPFAVVAESASQGGGGTPMAATPTAGTPASGTPMTGMPILAGATPAGTPMTGTPIAGTPAAGTPAAASQTDGIPIAGDQIERYGYQSPLSPLDVYRSGIKSVDRFATTTFGANFVSLSPQQQDQVVGAIADGSATGFDPEVSASSFFSNLRRHTSEGMFSDPVYGGNRNMAGWRLVGFPGAQRAYQPYEFQQEGGTPREPQSILQMSVFHAGHETGDDNALDPVSGPGNDGDNGRPVGNG